MLAFLLPGDPKEAQQGFNSPPVENHLDLILRARGKDRLHSLFLSKIPELIHPLPELKIFSMVKEEDSNLKLSCRAS
jgi:hypothetical protein